MLIIEYDPIKGKVIPDGEVREWADKVVEMHNKFENMHNINITVSSVLMVNAIRVLVTRGKLEHEKIIYRFEGKDVEVDKRGYLKHQSEGFYDIYDCILEDLLGWNDYT